MATVRKHRKNWIADFRDAHGRRRRERPEGKFPNRATQKRAAQVLLKKRLEEVERGSYLPSFEKPTFATVAQQYLDSKQNLRPSTRRSYEGLVNGYLSPFFGPRRIDQISAANVEEFRNQLTMGVPDVIAKAFAKRAMAERPGLSKARAKQRAMRRHPGTRTVNKALVVASMIFRFAAKRRLVDWNPLEYVERLRPVVSPDASPLDTNILAPAEIAALIEAADGPRRSADGVLIGNNYKLLIKIAIFTGVRSGEIRALRWSDVDWRSQQIHIRRSWKEGRFLPPKTAASIRKIELPSSLVHELREWKLGCTKGEDDLVFPNLVGKPLSNENLLRRGFYPALRRAGLRRIRFHDLRHTFASLLIANGEDVVRVSRLLGHASPTITLRVYSHMLPREHYGSAERLMSVVLGKATSGLVNVNRATSAETLA